MSNISTGEEVVLEGTWTVKEIKDGVATIRDEDGNELEIPEKMLSNDTGGDWVTKG